MELGLFDLGFKGKAIKGATRLARRIPRRALVAGGAGAAGLGAAGLAGGGGGPGAMGGPGGMKVSGLYRVSSDGTITKVSMPRRRRRGYRMPRMVAEQLRANTQLMQAVATAVTVGAVKH